MARTTVNLAPTAVNGFVATHNMPKRNSKKRAVTETQSDLRLAKLVSEGDEQAFATLVDHYHVGMVRLARTFIPTRALAEERVNDAWMDILENIKTYDGLSSLKTWIFCSLHDRLSQGPQSAILKDQLSNFPMHDQTVENGDRQVQDVQTVFRQATSKVSFNLRHPQPPFQAINQGLAFITPIQRQVMTLRDIERFSSDEVCEILRISEVTYHTQLHLARTLMLKTIMKTCKEGSR